MVDYTRYNDYLTSLDTQAIQEDNTSLFDSVTNAVEFGLPSAITSGVLGITNTVKAALNVVGADIPLSSEKDAITSLFGADTGSYYMQHKTASDFAGLLVGGVGVGLGALKSLHALQARGVLSSAAEVATGMRNSDIVLGSKAVQFARGEVLSSATSYNLSNVTRWNAYAAGLKQQALENTAITGAILLTQNQDALLNPDGLGYIDAIKSQFVESLPFLAVGTLFGSGIEAFKINGYLKSELAAAKRVNIAKETSGALPLLGALPAGDKLIFVIDAKQVRAANPELVRTGNYQADASIGIGDTLLSTQYDRSILALGEKANPQVAKFAIDKIAAFEPAARVQALAGLTGIEQFSPKLYADSVSFAKKSAATRAIFDTDSVTSVEDQMSAFLKIAATGISENREGWTLKISPELFKSSLQETGGTVAPGTVMRYLKGSYYNRELATVQLGGLVQVEADSIESLYRVMKDTLGRINPLAKEMTLADFKEYVTLHEISAAKAAGNNQLIAAVRRATASGTGVFPELESLSRRMYPESWSKIDATIAAKAISENVSFAEAEAAARKGLRGSKGVVAKKSVFETTEASNALDLVTNAAALMTNSRFAETVARDYPKTAALLRRYGAAALPFSPTRSIMNLRTGAMSTSTVPLAQDLGKIVQEGQRIGIAGTSNFWKYDINLHGSDLPARVVDVNFETGDVLADVALQAQAQFATRAAQPVSVFVKEGIARANAGDFAAIERLATATPQELGDLKLAVIGKDGAVSQFSTQADLRAYLVAEKQKMKLALVDAGLNEKFIAHILNTGERFAMSTVDTQDALLMGIRDYTKPENVVMRYTRINPKDVQHSIRSMDAVNWRIAEFQQRAQLVSASLLGDTYGQMPNLRFEQFHDLNPAQDGATLFKAASGEFGSSDEAAIYVNRIVHNAIDKKGIALESELRPFYDELDNPTAFAERMQHSFITNLARRHDLELEVADNGKSYVVNTKTRAAFFEQAKEQYNKQFPIPEELKGKALQEAKKELASSAEAYAQQQWSKALPTLVDAKTQNVIELLPVNERFFNYHLSKNADFITKDRAIADANGRHLYRNAKRIYAPPLSLRETPYYAFVVPEEMVKDVVGSSKYMVYGRTSEELRQKMQYLQDTYGGQYKVVTDSKNDLELYKKLQGEYDKGKVLNEWDFDSNLHRTGTATDFLPSPDLKGSTTLDLYRNFYHRKNQYHIRAGVELRYPEINAQLKALDEVYDAANTSKLGGRTDKATPFARVRNMMLDINNFDGEAHGGWKRVNSMLSEKGSEFLNGLMRVIAGDRVKLTQAEYDAIASRVESLGMTAGIKDVTRAIAASPEISDKRLLDSLVRTMNMFVATFQLPLDFLNSFLQVVSTPILASSAFREAKVALARTEAGAQLDRMTGVVNPATGIAEPTFAKLAQAALTDVFDDTQKGFHAELRARNIVMDKERQYLEAMDFSGFTGRHALGTVQNKLDSLRKSLGKWTGHQWAEDFGRLWVAHMFRRIAQVRGMGENEMYAMVSNAVDKVHGVYRRNARAQVFNGVVGQAVGLYQTYMFNLFQTMTRHLENRNLAALAVMTGMQSTIFGVRSLPGFTTLNNMVAGSNGGHVDLYDVTQATGGDGTLAEYMMYGAASHMFVLPVDVFSRGDIAIRNTTILPTDLAEIPAIAQIGKFVANTWATLGNVAAASAGGDGKEAFLAAMHGLAHNGLSRPLQGLGTVALGSVTSKDGTVIFPNANFNEYDQSLGYNYAGMMARFLGGKSTREAVLLDEYYRKVAYRNAANKDLAELGQELKIAVAAGNADAKYEYFAQKYEAAGGNPENFNSYFGRQMTNADNGEVQQFREKLTQNSAFQRTYDRMMQDRSVTPIWNLGVTDQ